MEPINRPRLTADLDRLSASISALLGPMFTAGLAQLPGPTRAILSALLGMTAPASLSQAISSSLSRLSALTDDDLVTLIDALASELGVLRNVRNPRETSPELEAALAHLREALIA
jgi:hypothetical protein